MEKQSPRRSRLVFRVKFDPGMTRAHTRSLGKFIKWDPLRSRNSHESYSVRGSELDCAWQRGRNLELQRGDLGSVGDRVVVCSQTLYAFSKIRRTTLWILSSFHIRAVKKPWGVFSSTFRSILDNESICLTQGPGGSTWPRQHLHRPISQPLRPWTAKILCKVYYKISPPVCKLLWRDMVKVRWWRRAGSYRIFHSTLICLTLISNLEQ